MYFTLYSYAKDIAESKELFEKVISKFPPGEITESDGENYWKIEGVFVYGAKLNVCLSIQEIRAILENICDKWLNFGSPVQEFLASDTIEGGCTFFDNRIKMIIVYLDE